jgi:hypothetical protein
VLRQEAFAAAGHVDLAATFGEVEVFERKGFQGDSWRTSLSYTRVGDDWNEKTFSIIVYSGTRAFSSTATTAAGARTSYRAGIRG